MAVLSGNALVASLTRLGITHVVWLPDSEIGLWESALVESPLTLLRVCREGEAWPLAAGLHVGGKASLVLMQTTGFFESGDAMRNVVFDLGLPLFAVVGARNWLVDDSADSAKRFAEPILHAWGLDYVLIAEPAHQSRLEEHYLACRQAGKPGIALLAEGRG